MTTVIGIDPSLTSTGIATEDATWTFNPRTKGMERLHDILNHVVDTIRDVHDPYVVIESYSYASKNSQAHALGELGGVIRLELWRRRIPYTDIPPTVRAKFATGKGNASKSEVVSAISARTGIIWSGKGAEDECDAWVLQEIGLQHFEQARYDWPKQNLQALEKIEWG